MNRVWSGITLCLVFALAGCAEKEVDSVNEADWQTIRNNILQEAPKIQYPMEANLENKLTFLGYDIDHEPVKAGEDFTITYYYRCDKKMTADWTIFIHVDTYMDVPWRIHADHDPINGLYKTSMWKPGEIIRDIQTLKVADDYPVDQATIYLGLFRGERRLKVLSKVNTDGNNRIAAGTLKIAPKAHPLPSYNVKYTPKAITIDGVLDDEWKEAEKTGPFKDQMGKVTAKEPTEAMMLWDEKNLYIAFDCKDSNLLSRFKRRDEPLYEQDVVEIFLDQDHSLSTYTEIEVSPANVIFDAFFPYFRRDHDLKYDSGAQTAVKATGTLNDQKDEDQGYTVEIALPFDKMRNAPSLPPKAGDTWHLNLVRINRLKDGGSEGSTWSPIHGGDFHWLHRFGKATFQAGPAAVADQKAEDKGEKKK